MKPAFLLLFKYAHFGSQIFIPVFRGRSKDFSVPKFFNFLIELDLVGGVMCVVSRGSPVDFFGGLVFLNKEGEIFIFEKKNKT